MSRNEKSLFFWFRRIGEKTQTAGATLVQAELVSQFPLTLPNSYDSLVPALENVPEKELTLNLDE